MSNGPVSDGFRLPARFAPVVMAVLLSVLMTMVVSLISSLRGVGLSAALPQVWLSSWGLSWLVAFPTLLLVLPMARRVTARLCRKA